jgi:hypothetical protein
MCIHDLPVNEARAVENKHNCLAGEKTWNLDLKSSEPLLKDTMTTLTPSTAMNVDWA